MKQERQFFAKIAELLRRGRSAAYRAVNSIMVETCWRIGNDRATTGGMKFRGVSASA